jgi:hypothetical protein
MEKPTPEFIWEMRSQISQLQNTWSKFPSGSSDCSNKQYAHYNNVSSMIDMLRRNVEFAAEELKRGE